MRKKNWIESFLQTQEDFNLSREFNSTISEEVVYLIQSLSKKMDREFNRDDYYFALIGACLVDLYIRGKIEIVNNRVVAKNFEKFNLPFLDHFFYRLAVTQYKRTVFEVFSNMKKYMRKVDRLLTKDLIKKKLLVENSNGFLPFSKNQIYLNSQTEFYELIIRLKASLDTVKEPKKPILYLLTILQAMNLTPYLYRILPDVGYGIKRLELLMKTEPFARHLLQTIDIEIKLHDLSNMTHRTSSSGIMQRFF